ncbi:MAG: TetR family transcriptional regulator [Hyphomicrobiales bacterium]|nr:TetR family transcriptional regulator [Hyphomicrobiales bacterium]
MLDETTPRGRIVAAALRLAAERPWTSVSLEDIAKAAGMGLVELRPHVGSKSQIVAVLMRAVDDEVLRRAPAAADGQAARDRLFDVIMTRFDVLNAHKPAIRSIAKAGMVDSTLVMPFLNAQRWMMAAAGIDADGPLGLARVAGVGSVYASVFNTWLDDDDPGMARTMAALDQRLRRGERTISAVEGAVSDAVRLATTVPRVVCSVLRGARRPAASQPEPAPQPPTQ